MLIGFPFAGPTQRATHDAQTCCEDRSRVTSGSRGVVSSKSIVLVLVPYKNRADGDDARDSALAVAHGVPWHAFPFKVRPSERIRRFTSRSKKPRARAMLHSMLYAGPHSVSTSCLGRVYALRFGGGARSPVRRAEPYLIRRAAQCTLGWLNSSRDLNLNILFDAESMCRRKRACER